MALSTATVTVSSFDIGPCRVTFDAIDIGGTLGNVTCNFKYTKADMKADQTGSALLDQAISGLEVTVETEFAEVRDKAIMHKLFPNVTYDATSTAALDWGNQVPARQLPLAKELTLHPLVNDNAVVAQDWTFFKAVPSEESSYVFDPANQGKMKIVWKVYMPTDTYIMFRYGDTTI